MRGYETSTASTTTTAPRRVEPAAGAAALVGQGDFTAGLRARPHDVGACGTFASGMSGSLTAAARTSGGFASGTRAFAGLRVIGDFATGMRARDDARRRPDTARPRSDRERQELHWARA